MARLTAARPQNATEFEANFPVSRETLDRLRAFVTHLEKWQEKMNLVASSTLGAVWSRHILDSAQILALLPDHFGTPARRTLRIADVGSGAGFPGIILAILGAGEVHLIESDQRRAVFLGEALRITDTEATVHAGRCQDMDIAAIDVVTARACAPLDRLLSIVTSLIGPETVCLFHKGQDVDEELTRATKYWSMEVSRHPSITDAGGTILQLENVRPSHDRVRDR